MSAEVWEGTVQIVDRSPDGVTLVGLPSRGYAYKAYCLECVNDVGVGWHGPAHIVGLESFPNAAAIDDADAHDREAGHTV